jgi:hypothetical protein
LRQIPVARLPGDLDQVRRRLEKRAAAQLEHGELQLED